MSQFEFVFRVVRRQYLLAEVAPVHPTKTIVHVRAPVAACGALELAVPFYELVKLEFQ